MKTKSILFCALIAVVVNSFTAAKAQVNVNDSLALVDLYNSTNGPQWNNHTNWLTTKPVSTWWGITVTNNRVTEIDLFDDYLTGTIPVSIGNLQSLTILNLGSGSLELFHVQNHLTGAIPSSIGNLISLEYLYLEVNQLSDTIPASIGNLQNLYTAYLYENQLTGTIPASIGNLKSLTFLYLDYNQLSGTIPSTIVNLINLQSLELAYNKLHGSIPREIGNLTKLTTLGLGGNQLTGAVPASFHKLTKLSFLDISYNQLSSFEYTNAALTINSTILGYVNNNLFTFHEVQFIATNYHSTTYAPQDTILPIHQNGNVLSVSAGGTLSKNTYTWYKTGDAGKTVIDKDSTFTPAQSGMYYVLVTNKIAKGLTLYSDTISYTAPLAETQNSIANVADVKTNTKHFSIYPNPAKDIIHVQVNGNATVILTNSTGKILLSKTINNSDAINVSGYANGVYYLQNKTTGETQKIIVVH